MFLVINRVIILIHSSFHRVHYFLSSQSGSFILNQNQIYPSKILKMLWGFNVLCRVYMLSNCCKKSIYLEFRECHKIHQMQIYPSLVTSELHNEGMSILCCAYLLCSGQIYPPLDDRSYLVGTYKHTFIASGQLVLNWMIEIIQWESSPPQ